jgi:hypothetical protein
MKTNHARPSMPDKPHKQGRQMTTGSPKDAKYR